MDKKEYKSLTIPRLLWEKKSLTDVFGELTAQPLEPGFGITLGNALRRVLLGAIEGSAVTSVIIKGINNEFSVIPGVVEDGMELLLNIKEIVIRNKEGNPGKMQVKKAGKGPVRVSDIKADGHLELLNKDHVLAHLADDGELEIEFFVDTGRGYVPAQWPADKSYQTESRIYVDAMYSPIRKVMFDVEKTRVGKDIDYDRLILRIDTNGAETPVGAVHYAVSVLRAQFEHFLEIPEIPFNEISAVTAAEETKKKEPVRADKHGLKDISTEILLKPIDELELSVRAHNCLLNAGIKRVIDLVNKSKDEVLRIKNFGLKSLGEVEESLKAFGLEFGMNIREEDLAQETE